MSEYGFPTGCTCCGAKVVESVPCPECKCPLCSLFEEPDECCAAAIAAEREACAKLADDYDEPHASHVADAIRKRGDA